MAGMSEHDFGIDDLARYLHLDVAQVTKMADRGRLPGRKIAGQWRFARADIHQWLEQRIGVSDADELAQWEVVLERSADTAADDETTIEALMPYDAVAVPFLARTKTSVISGMVDLAARTGWLWDVATTVEAVRRREEMLSTALENGVAMLHPRRPLPSLLAQPVVALGVTSQGVPFGGAHGALSDIFFLICSVNDRDHLRTFARLSRIINSTEFLNELRSAENGEVARQLLLQRERRLIA